MGKTSANIGLKITSQCEWRGPCPVDSGKDTNFAVNAETGLAQHLSRCGRGWDVVALEMELAGLDFARAKEHVFELLGRPRVLWEERKVEALTTTQTRAGNCFTKLSATSGKNSSSAGQTATVDGSGDSAVWAASLSGYRSSPRRISSQSARVRKTFSPLSVCMAATCNNGGAGNFKPELASHFSGKRVAIFPDSDEPGRAHALKVAEILAPMAKPPKIVELTDLPAKGEVTDCVNAGGTLEALREFYRKALPWTPEWQFAVDVPAENEKYIRTIEQEVEAAGGLTAFRDLAKLTGLPTSFPKLDWMLGGGIRNGEVYVIGTNQGAGKTSIVLQFALAPLRKGVLIFSMEMGWRAVFERMAGIEARVDLPTFRDQQRHKREDPEDRLRLSRATGELRGRKLLVSTKAAITPEHSAAETKRLAARSPIDLLICGHMQVIAANETPRSDYGKFAPIRAMKRTAVEVNVPLALVSQTSRSNSRERRAELGVADLRGSGAIEEDAAGVFPLFEHREDAEAARSVDGESRYTKGPARSFLKIGKNRYGEQGRCLALSHHKAQTRFEIAGEEAETELGGMRGGE